MLRSWTYHSSFMEGEVSEIDKGATYTAENTYRVSSITRRLNFTKLTLSFHQLKIIQPFYEAAGWFPHGPRRVTRQLYEQCELHFPGRPSQPFPEPTVNSKGPVARGTSAPAKTCGNFSAGDRSESRTLPGSSAPTAGVVSVASHRRRRRRSSRPAAAHGEERGRRVDHLYSAESRPTRRRLNLGSEAQLAG